MSAIIYQHPRMQYTSFIIMAYEKGLRSAVDGGGRECFYIPKPKVSKTPRVSFAKPFSKLIKWRKK